ncbi:MAG TPA: dienelactone hydrolase family protein [Acidimicrobiia bacterium]|nr:dienelactone hydrolase family protein [Acidimicrobiia bacterium]
MPTDRTFDLSTADGDMAVYEAAPDADASRAVIVVQEAFGVNDHIRDVARRFAAEGYHAVAPAFFHRAGGGTAPYDDFTKVMELFDGLDNDAVLVDVDAVLAYLHGRGFENSHIGIVGFCFGGRVTFLTAATREIGASVGFYGGGITAGGRGLGGSLHEMAGEMRTPWLGLFGDLDEHIPVDGVEQLRADLAAANVPTDVVRYPDAGHAFHCDERESYHEPSAKDAWDRTLAWFDTYLD